MNNIHITVVLTETFSVCQPSHFLHDALGKKLSLYFAKLMDSCKKEMYLPCISSQHSLGDGSD